MHLFASMVVSQLYVKAGQGNQANVECALSVCTFAFSRVHSKHASGKAFFHNVYSKRVWLETKNN